MPDSTPSNCTIISHPLLSAKLSVLRDAETDMLRFRRNLKEISALLLYEALRGIDTKPVRTRTPLAECDGGELKRPVVIVPILRAGLGFLEGMLTVLPEAKVGHLGMYRDEKTLEPKHYYFNAPEDLDAADVVMVDPMLATGRSAAAGVERLKRAGATRIRLVCLVGCPEGVSHFHQQHPDTPVFLAALDSHLDKRGYIVPGLGDAGDRYFGT